MWSGRDAVSYKPRDAALGCGRGEGRTLPVPEQTSVQEPSDTCGAFRLASRPCRGTQLTRFSSLACLI